VPNDFNQAIDAFIAAGSAPWLVARIGDGPILIITQTTIT
jgi:hypothetical protein